VRQYQTLSRAELQKQQQKKRVPWRPIAGVVALVVVAVVVLLLTNRPQTEELAEYPLTDRPLADVLPPERNGYYAAAPEMQIDTAHDYQALITTAKGEMLLDLFEKESPITVNNFVFLARQGFYDGVTFHRVLDGFMAQGGDPTGSGSGGPGYQFQDEMSNGLSFDRAGLLAMANAGANTNGSQFFITFAPVTYLDGAHTIFGEVIQGAEVLDSLTRRDPQAGPNFGGDPIERITILENGEPS
jgi:peptidylprolyl isomerase